MSILWTVLLLILGAAVCVAVTIHFLARMLLRPPRMTDGKALYVLRRMSPGDLGLAFETKSFEVPGSEQSAPIRIAGWWIAAPARSEKTVVIIHGYGDAKVGALAWTPTWRDLGYNCLLIDLRAHGESGGSVATGGVLERDDLDFVLNRLRADRAAQSRQVVLFGVSLGGAVALAVAAQRDDIHAVVTDSVFADYAGAAIAHGGLIGAPLPSLLPLMTRWAQRLAGVRFAEASPLTTLPRCRAPVLLIHGELDPFVPEAHVLSLGKALVDRNNPLDDHWLVEGSNHVTALAADPVAYRERLADFLARADAAAVPGDKQSQ